MHKVVAVMTILAGLLAAPGAAWACGDGVTETPVVSQADQLLVEAVRLERAADSSESAASTMDLSAERLIGRARDMRQRANVAGELDRGQLLARADQLQAQAALVRAQAAERRADASSMRSRARALRVRAQRLANGGTWRERTALNERIF
jgi:hypothetical protein